MNISTASTILVKVPVSATANGAPYNPTADAVALAFVAVSQQAPQAGDWHPGSWDTAGPPYEAAVLVGPAHGGVQLPVGTYAVWVQVTTPVEVPVIAAGVLTVE